MASTSPPSTDDAGETSGEPSGLTMVEMTRARTGIERPRERKYLRAPNSGHQHPPSSHRGAMAMRREGSARRSVAAHIQLASIAHLNEGRTCTVSFLRPAARPAATRSEEASTASSGSAVNGERLALRRGERCPEDGDALRVARSVGPAVVRCVVSASHVLTQRHVNATSRALRIIESPRRGVEDWHRDRPHEKS